MTSLTNLLTTQPGPYSSSPSSGLTYVQSNYRRATVHHASNPHRHVLYGANVLGSPLPNDPVTANPVLDVPYGIQRDDYTAQQASLAEIALFPFVGFTGGNHPNFLRIRYKTYVFGEHQGLFTWTNGTGADLHPEKLFITFLEQNPGYSTGASQWQAWNGLPLPNPPGTGTVPGPSFQQVDWPDAVITLTDTGAAINLTQRRVIIANWVKGFNAPVNPGTELAALDDTTSSFDLDCYAPPTVDQPLPPQTVDETFTLFQNLIGDNSARLLRSGTGFHTSVVYSGSSPVRSYVIYTHVSIGLTPIASTELPLDGFEAFPPLGCAFRIP